MTKIANWDIDEVDGGRGSGNSWAARKEAEEESAKNVKNFPISLLKKIHAFEQRVEEVFVYTPVYLNFRKTMASIKVEFPINYKPNNSELVELDQLALVNNFQIIKTNSAIRLYRIKIVPSIK